jgi:hypothetical protein
MKEGGENSPRRWPEKDLAAAVGRKRRGGRLEEEEEGRGGEGSRAQTPLLGVGIRLRWAWSGVGGVGPLLSQSSHNNAGLKGLLFYAFCGGFASTRTPLDP